ncbi:prolipoprotein diacylglyceryl transferase [Mycobacterium lentiflavum]|uniref:Phosphatidylglycerol--prolipoprotein diacylglyceryl transferase n=1 Tax=Mycobacterium lentiflavum TaxID=141349 RepID=A0A0E3WCB1_MYCLN|nr:prolipoprotein diacylglyceryl transferase [Mycobacterium lentiflavum]CQD13347.1 prolipoprotein diacylglyceryl transferase [Mycobacterium lentiflavum]
MTMLPTYFPSPPQGVWHLGPLPIRAYALFIITGIVVALIIGDRRWAARGGQRGVIYDIALWVVPFGLIGGRLYHLATDWRTYWGPGGAGFGAAFRIWDGGLGIWGAVALGVLGAWIGCRRLGIPLPAFLDSVAPGIILAQAIGRLGNYFNQELYGRETTLPWGLEIFYRRDPSGYIDPHSLDGVSTGQLAVVVQPTFLYELLWNVLVFAILLYIDRRYAIGHGRLFAAYVALYCVGRFWVELLRDDTATHIAGIRINSFTATFVFIGAVVYIVLAPKGREDPESLRGKDHPTDAESKPEVEPTEELVSVAAASTVAATVAGADDDAGSAASSESVETAKVEEPEATETGGPQAEAEEPEVEEPVVEEAEAEEAEAEQPEAEEPEVEEPEVPEVEEAVAEEPEVEEPEVQDAEAEEATAEAEAEQPEADEPEADEPEAEEPEVEEAEVEEPAAEAEEATADEPAAEEPAAEEPEAEKLDADPETAEPEAGASEPDEGAEAAAETEESEPERSTPAVDVKNEEPAAEPPASDPAPSADDHQTRRRWALRRRNRRPGS